MFIVSTKDDVSFSSVKVGSVAINQSGINAGNRRVSQVQDGIDDLDAVNMRQFRQIRRDIDENIREVGNIKTQMSKMNKELRAGIAGASALGMVQMPSKAGGSALSAAASNYKGQSAVAIGYSRSSDNNRIHIKLGAGINTSHDVNLGGSIGLHW